MTFRKRLVIAMSIVIMLPLILCVVAFFVIGSWVSSENTGFRIRDYSSMTDTVQTFSREADEIYAEIAAVMEEEPHILEDTEYLEKLSEELTEKNRNSFLIVRKGDAVYYTDREDAAAEVLEDLPPYGQGDDNVGQRYFLNDMKIIVKQMDFSFEDGAEGSLFILTRIVSVVSRPFLSWMFLAMIGILILTAILLTRWLKSSVFKPIDELNNAMNQIRDGNFEYKLNSEEKGEIGNLYKNYEDMRLRLKESADEKIEREKGNRELISNISHDLKTPITSIKGYVEGIMDGIANTPEKQQKYLRVVYDKACDMDKLINELTLYSKMDNGRIPYDFHRINVGDYFRDCIEEIGEDLESRGIALNYSNLVAPDTMIIADPEQMKRVINNIISNSVKYMDKPQGRIEMRILDERDSIRIEIEDNGKGIAAKDLPNIFDRFYRADAARNSATGGSGIGLSIVKKIIEDHGGYIWATSQEGQGTCMHFVLRKYREQENGAVDSGTQTENGMQNEDVPETVDAEEIEREVRKAETVETSNGPVTVDTEESTHTGT